MPEQLASLQAMSPGQTSPTLGVTTPPLGATPPTLGATPIINGLAQSTHGIEQLAQASMQSPRLVTQTSMYNAMNFNLSTNNVNLNGSCPPAYPAVSINSSEVVANPGEVLQLVRNQGISHVKQEKKNKGTLP